MSLDSDRFLSTLGINELEGELRHTPELHLLSRILATALDDCRRVIHARSRARVTKQFVVEAAPAIVFLMSPAGRAVIDLLCLDDEAITLSKGIALAALEALDLELWMLVATPEKWVRVLDDPKPELYPEIFLPPRPVYELQLN